MLKRSTTKRPKISAQSPVNPLSNRNHYGNESSINSSISQHYSSPVEYTIDIKTQLKPPTRTSKKTPEVQISIGVSKENIENLRARDENSPLSLTSKTSLNKVKPTGPSHSFFDDRKSVKTIDKSIRREEYDDDFELTQKLMKLQNELSKLGFIEPRSPTSPLVQRQNIKISGFVEIVNQLKKVIEKFQLRDAVQKQEINRLRKDNVTLKEELTKIEQKLKAQEKAKDMSLFSPTRFENRLISSKRNQNNTILKLEEKAHSFAKSVLSSPSHKTFDLFEQKAKLLEAEMSTERPFKEEKSENSSHFNSISANNDSLLMKHHNSSFTSLQMLQNKRDSQIFFSSTPVPETKPQEFDPKETTEIDSLVQLRTVTMSDIGNLEGTCSSNQLVSNNNLSVQDLHNPRDVKVSTLSDPSKTRQTGLNKRKRSPEQNVPHRLQISHQKYQGCSSAISFPKTSFVPSKIRRDELSIKTNDRDLGTRSLSQPRYDRLRSSSQKEARSVSSNLSPTASRVVNQYKRYLNEPHASPLQSECKSINMDFRGNYLNGALRNMEDTRNLSLNNLNSPTHKGHTQSILTDEISKIVIPEEFGSMSLKEEKEECTPEEEKVTLFNRCLKLTMGLSSSVLDENQKKRNEDKRTSIPIQNIVLSPSVLNMKKNCGFGVSIRK